MVEINERADVEASAKADDELDTQFLETEKEIAIENLRVEMENRIIELQEQL